MFSEDHVVTGDFYDLGTTLANSQQENKHSQSYNPKKLSSVNIWMNFDEDAGIRLQPHL